jgi:hypothetical protein
MRQLMKTVSVVLSLSFAALLFFHLPAFASAGARTIDNPAGVGARLPRLTTLPNGSTLLSWIEGYDGGHVLKYAVYQQGRWEKEVPVAHGEDWFINWADFPSVMAISDSFWVTHWLVKSPGGRSYEYDIQMSFSQDAGRTWSESQIPHRDGIPAEHGFASMFPVEGGAGIIWLDGRADQQSNAKKFSLRYTKLDYNGKLGPEEVVDGDTCTCCWTAAAVTPSGPIAAWRGRRDGKIRDHHVARMVGDKWTSPVKLGQEGWSIDGCPVNGPALATYGNQVVAAWFTAEGNKPRVRMAFSSNAGKHFFLPVNVDVDRPIGRVSVAWLDQSTALVAWLTKVDSKNKNSWLAVRKVSTNGMLGHVMPLLKVSPGRSTGIPQLARIASGFMLAWTEPAPNYGIRTMEVPSSIFN